MIARTAGITWLNAFKAKAQQIQLLHERIDNTHRIVFGNVIISSGNSMLWYRFSPSLKRFIDITATKRPEYYNAFLHGLGQKQTFVE
jgi:hypothetical protein